jgi:hypothetical protein
MPSVESTYSQARARRARVQRISIDMLLFLSGNS